MTKNNEYLTIADELFRQEPEQEAKISMSQAVNTNADDYAESYKLAQQEVLPIETVEKNKEQVKKNAQLKQFSNEYTDFLDQSPQLAEFLRVPENARLSFDDIENMGTIERTFKTFGKAYEQGRATNILGRTAFLQNSGVKDFEISQKQIENLEGILSDVPEGDGFLNNWVYPAAKIIGQVVDSTTKASAVGLGAAGTVAIAGQLGPQAATPEEIVTVPTAFVAGTTAAMAADAYMIESGHALLELSRIEKESGQKLDPIVKQGAAMFVGTANAALEMVGIKYASAPFRKAFNKYLTDTGADILKNKTRAAAVRKFFTGYTKAVAAETSTEIMQEGVNIFAEQVAQQISYQNFQNILNDPKQAEAAFDRILNVGGEVFRGMALLGVAGPSANFTVDYGKARKAQRNKDMMLALGDNAQNSKLLNRVPEKYREFIAASKGQVENVYINANDFQTYFQSKEIDPNQIATELGVDNQIEEALTTGGDLVIPVENYAEKMAATEFHPDLVQNMKFSPDDFTIAEAEEINANIQTTLQEQYQAAEQQQFEEQRKEAPAIKVYDDVFSQLRKSGRSLEVAEKEASLWRAFFQTMGERSGVDPYSLYKKQNISITQELPEALRAKNVTELDLTIEKYKSFKGISSKKAFGDSLVDFVAKEGINANDVNAEDLVSIGIEEWHKEKKFRKRVLREKDGRSLDDVALAAWEAGYFPESAGRPDINQLIDKIDTELRGQPQYSDQQGDANLADEKAQIDQLDQFFNELGIDPETQTNDEIKEIIANYEKGVNQSGGEFFQVAPKIDSEAFKEWFGDSQVVDEQGNPLVVYHGTNEQFSEFNKDKSFDGAFWFTEDKSKIEQGESGASIQGQPIIKEVYLSAKNLAGWDEYDKFTYDQLIQQGYDGVKLDDDYIIFEPTQIKSVDNKGAFSAKNPNIFFQSQQEEKDLVAPKLDSKEFKEWFGSSQVLDEDGKPLVVYHGSTQNIEAFDPSKSNPESDFGAGIYFSNNVEDIANNYAGFGPDLTQRIDLRAELAENEGNTMPVYVSMQNPVNVGGENETFFDYNDETGLMVDAILELRNMDGQFEEFNAEQVITDLTESGLDDGMSVSEMVEKMKMSEGLQFATDENGNLMGNEIIRQLFENLGFDGIIDSTVNKKFGTEREFGQAMAGVDENTKHFIAFKPEQVKSVFNRGTFSTSDPRILFQDDKKSFVDKVKGDKRGSFTLTDQGEKVIKLFEKADLSTFLHESGHFFLEAMGELNNSDNATADIKNDYKAILDFLEVDDVSQIGTEQHEKFARAFEAYAFEGKAPSVELQNAFRRFRQWLVNIYRQLRNLDVELSDEIRGVFDRMLATEEQIKTAEELNNYAPLLTKDLAGMTEAEYQDYLKSAERATFESENDLMKKLMNEIKRERLKTYKDEKAKVREQAEKDLMQQPVNQALYYLQKGELFDRDLPKDLQGLKLDTKTLEDTYGKEVFKLLPKAVPPLHKRGGVHPDTLAEIFGFDSGDALIKSLWNVNNLTAQINERTEQIMKERHGDILNDGSIEEEAAKSIKNDSRAKFLATELKALSKRTGQELKSPQQIAKLAAQRFISETLVKDIRLGKYASAEVRAAKNAQQAVADGNFALAVEEKRKQLFNHHLFIEGRKAQEHVEKTVKYMNKFNKKSTRERLGKARGNYLEQIDSLLERFDFRKSITIKAIKKRESLTKWIEKQREEGNDVVIDERLEDEAYRKSYKVMPTEELFALEDTVRNIEHLARTKNKLIASKDAREFGEVVDSITGSIEKNNKLKELAPDFAPSFTANIKKGTDKYFAAHTKMEFLFEQLDGNKDLGPVWESLFKPIADAENAEQELMAKTTKRLNAAFADNYSRVERAKWYVDKVKVEGVNKSFNKASIISLALNWGNEGNRQAIRDGYGWSDAQVREILDNLEKKDWLLVQEIWDTIDELWPASQQLHKDVTGIAPPKVDASPINTKHGTFKGGYYPLKYDPEWSFTAFKREQKESTQELFGSNWIRPQTKQGHLKERVGSAGQKVKLDLGVMTEHITNTIHDISHRKAIMDVDRLTRNPKVRDMIERAAGKEMYKQIRPWLRNIANDRREPAGVLEGIMGRARVGATVVNMAWKVTTGIVQPLGYLQSVDLLGEKYGFKGLKKFYGNPLDMKNKVEFVMERSTMMQNRQKTYDRDVRDTLKKTTLKGPLYEVQQSFFYFTGLMDMGVAVPTWLAAYEKAMDGAVEGIKSGNENKAIDYADKTVRMSQSAGGAKDLAVIQTGAEYHRIFTMFYSYFNVLYNLFRKRGQTTKSVKDIPRFAASMMYLWIAPAILSELIAGRGPDEDEEPEEWAAKNLALYPLSTVVGVRDISNAVLSKYGYNASPAFDAFEKTAGAFDIPYKLAIGEEVKRSDVKDAALAVGYWGQLPGRQMWITGEYLYDYATGEEDEFNFRDLFFARKK